MTDFVFQEMTRTEYLTDLENTRRKVRAYHDLSTGYATLAGLPENAGKSYLYHPRSYDYALDEKQCLVFLFKLEKLNPEDFPDD